MARIGFIGLGSIGLPMAASLVRAGHEVVGYDVSPSCMAAAGGFGIAQAASLRETVSAAEFVISIVRNADDVRQIYLRENIAEAAAPGTLFVDCTTIDLDTADDAKAAVRAAGHDMLDAPVSGGIPSAEAGTLTVMVGGTNEAFRRCKPVLDGIGEYVAHLGPDGTGLVAKICNNMVTGVSLAAVSEAFALAKRLGLDGQKFYDIASRSTAQCWSLTSLCPIPGPVPRSPANFGYRPGGKASILAKDLGIASAIARRAGAAIPLGERALSLYEEYCDTMDADLDCSAIIKLFDQGIDWSS